MNKTIAVLSLILTTTCFSVEASTSRISGFLGTKKLDDNPWKPFNEQLELGAMLDIRPDSWPVSIATGVYWSADAHDEQNSNQSYTENNGTTTELLLGLRRTLDFYGTNLHPYYAAGLAYISGEKKDFGQTQKDSALGYWVGTGVYWTFTQHFDIGIEGRYSKAEAEFSGKDVELGGTHLGFTLGYSW